VNRRTLGSVPVIYKSEQEGGVICTMCRKAIEQESPRTITILLPKNRRELFRPEDILAAVAADKGVWFHLRDGRKLFDLHTIKAVEKRYPGEFLRINRGILVRQTAIKAVGRHPDLDDSYGAEVEGVDGILTISRREWRKVATALGWTLRNGQRAAYRNLPPRYPKSALSHPKR
jgi:DNA-binding LytR/AlgR family response regulator